MPTSVSSSDRLPALPLSSWEETKHTLHLYLQVVGKLRLALTPKRNHWWHVPFYVTPRGLTTSACPCSGNRQVEFAFDFVDHRLVVTCSDGDTHTVDLHDGLSVQQFYTRVTGVLDALGIDVPILAEPFDHPDSTIPFADDTEHDRYDAEAVRRYSHVLTQLEPIFQTFRGRFVGKASPVHVFWHTLDLAYTRFSGRRAPEMPDADRVTQEAYSHEVVSFGFWAGDANTPEPSFYSYTYPEPDALTSQPLRPDAAQWRTQESGSLALLAYDDVRTSDDPEATLLDFLESAYLAGATTADWDVDALRNDFVS